jgi:uncharacterized protein YxjI
MKYPLFVNFKKIALAAQFTVTDVDGNVICYVKQKLFKLKEDIKVYSDRDKVNLLYSFRADRILDFSANYGFFDKNDVRFGNIKRKGMRSLWRAEYLIDGENQQELTLKEDSVFIRFMDGCISSFGIIGLCCSGLVFHPSYTVTRADGSELMRCKKMAAVFESKFKIELLTQMSETEEIQVLLGIMMMMILERARG